MGKITKMIACSTCGAEFDGSLVRCPFCGTAYEPAEENEYMEQLEDIRKDVESHKEDGDKSIKAKMSLVARTSVLVIIVVALIILGSMWLLSIHNNSRADSKKEEFLKDQGITIQQEEQAK